MNIFLILYLSFGILIAIAAKLENKRNAVKEYLFYVFVLPGAIICSLLAFVLLSPFYIFDLVAKSKFMNMKV